MKDTAQIIESIQSDILDTSIPLSTIFLKVKLLSHELKEKTINDWVTAERDGYPNTGTVPDYRIIPMQSYGTLANNFTVLQGHAIPLYLAPEDFQREMWQIKLRDGIRHIETLASSATPAYFAWPADAIAYFNAVANLQNGFQVMSAERAVSPGYFHQMLMTVRNRLQDFILELSDIPWNVRGPEKTDLTNLLQVTIFNQGNKNMTTFDQSNQQVQQQNNAGGDIGINGGINLGDMQNQVDFLGGLRTFRTDVDLAVKNGVLTQDQADDVNYNIAHALREAKGENPDQKALTGWIDAAHAVLLPLAAADHLVTIIENLRGLAQNWGT